MVSKSKWHSLSHTCTIDSAMQNHFAYKMHMKPHQEWLSLNVAEHAYLSNEDNVLAAELLLQLAHKAGLDLLVGAQLGHGHKDDDGLLSGNIDLL